MTWHQQKRRMRIIAENIEENMRQSTRRKTKSDSNLRETVEISGYKSQLYEIQGKRAHEKRYRQGSSSCQAMCIIC